MRHPETDGAMTPNQALWERLVRRACSASGPTELLACLLAPLAEAPGLWGALARETEPGRIEVVARHPAQCPLPSADDLGGGEMPATSEGCWWMSRLHGDQGADAWEAAAVVRRGPDGRRVVLVAGADQGLAELELRLRELGPPLATALSLPAREADNVADVGADPLEMTRYLSAALAHDVRNIMSGIIGALELHRSMGQGAGEEVFDAVRRRAVEGVAMVEAMMHRLRGGARPAGRRLDLRAAVADFEAAIQPLVAAMADEGVQFAAGGEPAQVTVERAELSRALLALVFNAWRACEGGGKVEVVVGTYRGRGTLEVRDDGAGMTTEVQRRVKGPFYTTEPQLHWGLGLTIAEEVAKQAGGSLVVRSGTQRGTTVTLSLPLS